MKLLDRVVESTTEYIETMPKTLRKKFLVKEEQYVY